MLTSKMKTAQDMSEKNFVYDVAVSAHEHTPMRRGDIYE